MWVVGPDSAFTQMERSRLIRYVTVLALIRHARLVFVFRWGLSDQRVSGTAYGMRERVRLVPLVLRVNPWFLDGASLVPRRQALPTSTTPPLGREHAPLCSSRPDYQLWASYRSKASTGQGSSAPHAPHAGSSPLARKTQNGKRKT
ncbi:hypothetical protein KVT40_002143 [Elsinoe batatas]|uniref:Uncharacterized protein n=1 Tax=Elsinoe batatas TaxID=2601811 RepID=A0A8K0PM03_9PEZI|nr:hypothetical protein KVT40_002143 [Elsinoe batatas]